MIAILEDDERRAEAMRAVVLELGCEATFFTSAPEMRRWLVDNLPSVRLMSLDHDLGPNRIVGDALFDPGTGRDVVDMLISNNPTCPVIVHSSNADASVGIIFALEGSGWQARRVYPYDDLDWVRSSWAEAVQELLKALRRP
jgi:FixJ family two-component response regulator